MSKKVNREMLCVGCGHPMRQHSSMSGCWECEGEDFCERFTLSEGGGSDIELDKPKSQTEGISKLPSPDSNSDVEKAIKVSGVGEPHVGHEWCPLAKYLEAGGDPECYIVSQKYIDGQISEQVKQARREQATQDGKLLVNATREARIEENVRLRRRYNGSNYEKLRATLNYRISQLKESR